MNNILSTGVARSALVPGPVLRVPRVLSIAGTDPTGGAGIQADLKSIAAHGGYGMAVVTALVAQNTQGVRSVHLPPVSFLVEQLDAVSDDVEIDAVKIGMLADAGIVAAVGDWLRRVRPPIVVIDPVMVATSGDRLLDREAERALRELVRLSDLVTPNIPELAVLADEPVAADWAGVLEQAHRVSERYGVTVLAKGGHLAGESVPDALVDAAGRLAGERTRVEFTGARIATANTHGTGCSLSSALATLHPVLGGWEPALERAKAWLTESIASGESLAVGEGNGPISHFADLWERAGIAQASADDLAEQWWADIHDIRGQIDQLDFVRALGDGTLDREAFLWYLAQDALYLRDYSRALAEASRLAPTQAEQAFWADSARGAIVAELQLHESFLSADGGVVEALPSPVTTAYLNHLFAAVARSDYNVLVAALLPCFWLYHDVGTRLHTMSSAEHPYAPWLDAYADAVFADNTRRAVQIVFDAAAAATRDNRAAMKEAFRLAAEHELAFFAAPLLRP
ncbi:hypothetical protein GCM10027416_19190 [Okibacterium endophyticum]